jgi:hypothetical protein
VTWHLLVVIMGKTLTDEISYFKSKIEQGSGKKQISRHPLLYASVSQTSFSPNPNPCL